MNRFSRCVLVVAGAQIAAQGASAQQAPSQPPSAARMEHVLVTTPLHKETAATALPFTVLSGKQLRRLAATTIGDTLSTLPGISSASFGPGVGQPIIRGQGGPRVLVLQNGTSSADAARASQDHANAVEALLASSIEILRGPSTLMYGGGAIGGVVNVLDNRIPTALPEALSGGFSYTHDTVSGMNLEAGKLEGSFDNIAFHLDAMFRDFDDLEIPGMAELEGIDAHDAEPAGEHAGEEEVKGHIPNTAGEASSVTFGSSYHFDRGFVGLSASRLNNKYGLPGGAHAEEHGAEHGGAEPEGAEPEEEEGGINLDMEQTRYDALMHLHDFAPGIDIARVFLTYTDYEHAEIEGGGEVGTLYANESIQSRVELVHSNVAGFDGVLGLQTTSGEFSALGEEAFIPITDYREWGLFLVEDYRTENAIYELGLRYDHEQRDPQSVTGSQSFRAFSAAGSALWSFDEDWQFGIAVSRSERAPSIEELYSNLGNPMNALVLHAATNAFEIGNTDLDIEVSRNIDLSLRWASNGSYASLQVYYNGFSDYIALVNTGREIGESPVRQFVQKNAEFVGLEFDSEFIVARMAGGAWSIGFFGDVTRGQLDNGDDVPRLPPLRLGAKLAWDTPQFSLWTRVLDVDDQDRAGANETKTPGFMRWDAGAEYYFPVRDRSLNLFLTVSNITDEEIRLSTSFLRNVAPEAGLGVAAGLRFIF